jgi:hypothetical protein
MTTTVAADSELVPSSHSLGELMFGAKGKRGAARQVRLTTGPSPETLFLAIPANRGWRRICYSFALEMS